MRPNALFLAGIGVNLVRGASGQSARQPLLTSKWNKIEHRLFSHIAMNWRGTPLVDLATIVSLIGSTHSRAGLHVRAELDRGYYPAGVAVTDAQLASVHLERHRFHGDWNYTIRPAAPQSDTTVTS